MGAVYAGWLTKSPEDRKGLFSLFSARKQWRRRYFVLYSAPTTSTSCTEENGSSSSHQQQQQQRAGSPSSSSPSPVLAYFEDETMAVRKGLIDLGNCEEIVDHVESCYYQHLFLLKTNKTQRGHRRTYYLAADSSDDVTNWVKKLRSTLNFDEDKLFTHAVLSITESGSDVTGIIATVRNLEVNSEASETSTKENPVNESSTLVNAEKSAVKQLSHIHWLIVNSETPTKCLDLSSSNSTSLCDSNSLAPVSKCGTKLANPKVCSPFPANLSAETKLAGPCSEKANCSVGFSPSSTSSLASTSSPSCGQSIPLRKELLSDDACTGQTGAKYCEDWPQFVKELLDDGDEQEQREEGTMTMTLEGDGGATKEGRVEGRSVFYVSNMSSLSPDAEPNQSQIGQRSNSPKSSKDESSSSSSSSAPPTSDGVTCYLRITKGSRRYKSRKKRTQNIADLF